MVQSTTVWQFLLKLEGLRRVTERDFSFWINYSCRWSRFVTIICHDRSHHCVFYMCNMVCSHIMSCFGENVCMTVYRSCFLSDAYSFLFYWPLLKLQHLGEVPQRRTIWEAGFLQAGCHSCCPVDNVSAVQHVQNGIHKLNVGCCLVWSLTTSGILSTWYVH